MEEVRTPVRLDEASVIDEMTPVLEQYQKAGFWDTKHALPMSDYRKAICAKVMENTRRALVPGSKDIDDAMNIAYQAARAQGWQIPVMEATTPVQTSAWTGATTIPMILGMIRKIMPKLFGLELVATQPLSKPVGQVYYITRQRQSNGTTDGTIEARAGWSYRSWTEAVEATANNKSVQMTLTSGTLTAQSRKLKSETSIEFEQDLQAYFGMDAVAALTEAASDEVALELNEYILQWLWASATGGTVYLGAKPSGYTWAEWNTKAIEVIQRASSLVNVRRLVEPTWAVLGAEWAVRLGQLSVFDAGNDRVPGSFGLRRVGTLRSTWDTFESPLPFPTSTALLGYKGAGVADAGALFAPYIPLQVAGTSYNIDTQVRSISWITRNAKLMINAGYFSLAVIDEATYTGLSYPAWVEYAG